MSAKNHIWPAYVDMMTVLLLVYILLNTMFSVVIANSVEKQNNNIVEKQNNNIVEKHFSGPQNNIDNRIVEKTYDKNLYQNMSDDLSLKIADGAGSLDDVAMDKMKKYILNHKEGKGKYLLSIYYHDDDKTSTGELTQRQAFIYYQILDGFISQGINYNDVVNEYSPPSVETESLVKIRFISCGSKEECDIKADKYTAKFR